MSMLPRHARSIAFVFGVAMLADDDWARTAPPSVVARLGYVGGVVGFLPAGKTDWVQARLNRPLTTGDRLWVDAGGRAEIQLGGAVVRMHAGTAMSVLTLDERSARLQLTQGTLNVRVRSPAPGQVLTVDTPHLAFTLRQPGVYRIEVDADGDATTTIVMRKGQGEVRGDNAACVIDARQSRRFTGTDLQERRLAQARCADEFDRWASGRDRRNDRWASASRASPEGVG